MNAQALQAQPEPRKGEVVQVGGASLMEVIGRAAADPSTDVDKLERLLNMYERITAQQAKAAYADALAQMQPKLPVINERGAIKNNTKVQSTYALWEDINDAIRPLLADHGFALSFRTGRTEQGQITVTGVLAHRDGHSEETTITLPADASGAKNDVQKVGSSVSYGQRYTAKLLLNITTRGEDDDGQQGGVREVGAMAQRAISEINMCSSQDDLRSWRAKNEAALKDMADADRTVVVQTFNTRQRKMKEAQS